MTEELKLARLEGKSYEEIQGDVIRLVNYYVKLWYKNYPVLKLYNYDAERIVTDVYHGIYLKTRDDGLSNLERHFIKASKMKNCTMSYISNVLRNSVINMLKCRARDVVRKPLTFSLDQKIPNCPNGKNILYVDTVKDERVCIENDIELKILLESLPNIKYNYYYIDSFGSKRKVTTKTILNWVASGYTIKDMTQKVFNKNGKNVSSTIISALKKESINLARKFLLEED